jgi:hypothetical protein
MLTNQNRLGPILVAAGLVLLTAAPAAAQWSSDTPLGQPLSQLAAAADDSGNLYLFEGRTSVLSWTLATNQAWKYDVCTASWSALPPIPCSSYGGRAITHSNGLIYFTAGRGSSPGAVFRFDPATETYATLTPAPTLTNSWQPTWIEDGATGRIHWIGGEDYGTEHLVYNPATDSWSSAAPPPTPVFGADGDYDPITGKLIVIAGWGANNYETGGPTNVVQIYDPASNSWSYGTSMPGLYGQRYLHTVDRNPSDGLFYVYGGSPTYFEGGLPVYNDIWVYDPVFDSWLNLGQNNPWGGNREMRGVFDSYGQLHMLGGNPATGPSTRHEVWGGSSDEDGDGFDDACGGDCDDGDPTVYPGAPELCDGLDNDCDGLVDDVPDADGDGVDACSDCDDTDPNSSPTATEICDFVDNDCDGEIDEGFDVDGDGFTTCEADCDPIDPTVFPGATEVCDGVDNDCDGFIDENGSDSDGDGFGCDDCDDSDATVYPGAPEICDGQDNDCDGFSDEGFDADGDGYSACGDDCDDTDPAVNPGATEVCDGIDNDCDGLVDEGFDADGDGYSGCIDDCDDSNPAVNPGAVEICDGLDNDCDGAVDEGFDADGDGYASCTGDCDDTDPAVNPGSTEVCDGIDNDCDGAVDENGADADGDGFGCDDCDDGDATVYPGAPELCDGQDNDCDGVLPGDEADADGDGWMICDGDCDDADASSNPDATEVCDGADNDCDGAVDEGEACGPEGCPELLDFDVDADGLAILPGQDITDAYASWGVQIDTYTAGSPGLGIAFDSSAPTGGDDDLGTPNVDFGGPGVGAGGGAGQPGQNDAALGNLLISAENSVDADCDGLVDDPDDHAAGAWFGLLFDEESCVFGLDFVDVEAGEGPSELYFYDVAFNLVATYAYPGLGGNSVQHVDVDICGVWAMGIALYGSGAVDNIDLCVGGEPEVCDGIDNDGDGVVPADEMDADGDGWLVCDGDCDDGEPTVFPGAPELCDGLDNDCDGVVPADEVDLDGDGWPVCAGDCDNWDPDRFPGNPEICDGLDNDCDGLGDEGLDADGDGISDCIDVCPMVLDYETEGWGDAIAVGQDVSDAYLISHGVQLQAYLDPTLEEEWLPIATDLLGSDGNAVVTPANLTDADGDGLVDDVTGADTNLWFLYTFNTAACVHSIDLIDVDTYEVPAQVILFDENVQTIATITASGLGDGTTETLDLQGICGVHVVMIDFYGDGAFDNFQVCIGAEVEICDGVDNDGDGIVDESCATGDDDDDDDDAAGDDDDAMSCSTASAQRRGSNPMGLALLVGTITALLRRRR